MPEVIVIADDLSGAADSGVAFAARGYQTLVIWDISNPPPLDVLVLSTESRHIPRDQAVAKVQNIAAQLSTLDDSALIYKKIDSTLRGHPAAELSAVMTGFGISKALVAPAFPAQDRVTVAGIHYVGGLPLDQTSFGEEVTTANIRHLFLDRHTENVIMPLGLDVVRQGEDAIAKVLQRCASQRVIAIADAETTDDLLTLVKAARAEGIRLYCGSAGLAAALAQTLKRKRPVAFPGNSSYNGVGVLGVIASRRVNTLRQIAFAKAHGIPVVCPDVKWLTDPAASVYPLAKILNGHLSTRGMVLLTAHELPDLPGKSAMICSRLADIVNAVMVISHPVGLVLSGGDMAYALSTTLGARAMTLRGEVQPGIPWGYLQGGCAHGCAVVTKAGGFGGAAALVDALRFLRSKEGVSG